MEDNKFLSELERSPTFKVNVGDILITNEWVESRDYMEIPMYTEVKVVDIEKDTNEVLCNIEDISIDSVYDYLYDIDWQCEECDYDDYGDHDCDDCDCMWEEAKNRRDNLCSELHWISLDELKPDGTIHDLTNFVTQELDDTPQNFTSSRRRRGSTRRMGDKTFLSTYIETTKKKKKFSFHKLNELLKVKTSGLRGKLASFFIQRMKKKFFKDVPVIQCNTRGIMGQMKESNQYNYTTTIYTVSNLPFFKYKKTGVAKCYPC